MWAVIRFGNPLAILFLGLPAGLLALLLVRSLWLGGPPPFGVTPSPEACPRLHDAVERIRRVLDAPRVHRLILIPQFDASVVRVPRLGLLGWYKNDLLLGLPLMHVLSADQFRGVIAHEFGHLSRNHAPFSAWVYRVRRTWWQLGAMLEGGQEPWWARLITKFAGWYAPFFSAYSFVLARADEYVADRCGVEVTDAPTLGEALIRIAVGGRVVDQLLDTAISQRADAEPEFPEDAVEDFIQRLRHELSAARGEPWLQQQRRVPTDYTDTHPSLSDRLAAIGYDPTADPERWRQRPVEETAAGVFLGDRLPEWTRELGQLAEQWRKRHEHVAETRQKLAQLDEKQRSAPLEETEAWDLARWTVDVGSEDEAIGALRDFLSSRRDHGGARARAMLGNLLLRREDPEGVGHLEAALEHEPELLLAGLELLAHFAYYQGRKEEADGYVRRLRNSYDLIRDLARERGQIRADDEFLPHDLPPAWVRRICEPLSELPGLTGAYLVRKRVKLFPEKPLYVLTLVGRLPVRVSVLGPPFRDVSGVAEAFGKMEFPGDLFVVLHDRVPRPAQVGIRAAAGEPVYSR